MDYDDELHRTYGEGRRLDPEVLRMWMEAVAGLVDPAAVDRVVDLGAGTGRFSGPLATSLGAHVVAVDPSRKMLQNVARETDRIVARAEFLPLATGSVDLVFASMVLHHVSDLVATAGEIRRVLEPSGSFVVRGCFAEKLDAPYHRFFPSVLEIERDLLPTTATIVDVFSAEGFALARTMRLRQFMDGSYRAYAERMRQRAMSPLRMISDDEFKAGMAALDEVAKKESDPVPVFENIDLLHFRAARTPPPHP